MEYPPFVRDFFKHLTCADCSSRGLVLPARFCDMQEENLSGKWLLSLRNGYKIEVVYDKANRLLLGMGDLFSDFELVGGEILIFEMVDGRNFTVYIVGEDGNEIHYPEMLHASQTSSSSSLTTVSGSWKFVKIISYADPVVDEVKLPRSFMREFGPKIPEWFTFVLKNRFMFGGHFDFMARKITGLEKVSEGLRINSFEKLELMIFTYDLGRFIKLSLFDGSSVEIGLDVGKISSGSLLFTFRYPFHFIVEVMPSHMLKYCPGVTVAVQFKRITKEWKNKEKIFIFKGSLSWEFEIRKSTIANRTTIHKNWITFRNDLKLNVGDKCFFRWINESYRHFRVEIVKGGNL